MDARGWDQCDFVYICGDAYVDHPSFGMAIVSRVLDAHGYKWASSAARLDRPRQHQRVGEPRLGFLVSAGNMDSMVNHYSVTKHRRHTDAYTPGGEEGHRPNRAVTVYGNLIRQTFKDAPIIIGGIEASLRRLAHYDYWQDKLKRSVLLDSGATSSSTAWASTQSSRSRRARRGAARRSDHLYQRHRLPHGFARRGLRLRPAAQLGRPYRRQAQLRPQL